MQFYLIRHGEPDWQQLGTEGQRGTAASLTPLSHIGRLQIDTIAGDYRLREANVILSSSYTRCLESAARLSRQLNKQLFVEYALHEWLPVPDPMAGIDRALLWQAGEDLRRELLHGSPADCRPWESLSEVRQRALDVLKRYAGFGTGIVVTHAVVISALLGSDRPVSHAEIIEYSLPAAEGGSLPPAQVPVQNPLFGQ